MILYGIFRILCLKKNIWFDYYSCTMKSRCFRVFDKYIIVEYFQWTPERFPKEGWTTDWKWSKEAVRSLDAFMDHYSSIGETVYHFMGCSIVWSIEHLQSSQLVNTKLLTYLCYYFPWPDRRKYAKHSGIEGIKDEFRKKLDGFKSVTYGDVAFKTNPTKNRDKAGTFFFQTWPILTVTKAKIWVWVG